ncbi:DAPG hydrolase family protein [Streptomyces sp. NPDC001933]|uniref:DAPG hydrolase family protein n=1 Tax=Streptomyces sp. NPDC001933 TaxID=3364626 RepID=UPI0036816E9B
MRPPLPGRCEYIGPMRSELTIQFRRPSELGSDTSRFAQSDIGAHACVIERDARRLRNRPLRPYNPFGHRQRDC